MSRHRVVLVLTVLLSTAVALPMAPPAEAYAFMGWSWRNPARLTYDYDDSVPAGEVVHAEEATDGWNNMPTPVAFLLTPKGEVRQITIYGYHGGTAKGTEGGHGSCIADSKTHYCVPGKGSVYMNVDYPAADYPRYKRYAYLHELGHVIGLAHVCTSNPCHGPVMSYGSCPTEDSCVVEPNYDDVNGVNKLYHYKPPQGHGCLAFLAGQANVNGTTSNTKVPEMIRPPSDPLTGTPVEGVVGPLDATEAAVGTAGKVLYDVNEVDDTMGEMGAGCDRR